MQLNRTNSTALAALLYAVGLAVITISPLTDWRFIPQAPWDYLFAPWPRYWTGFDLLVNVLAYIPLGALISRVFVYRRKHLIWAPFFGFLVAAALGAGLSIFLEGLQTYLPSRRAQLLDVISNTSGAMIGGFLASVYAQGRGRLTAPIEGRPIEIGMLMLIAAWLLAQAAQQPIWLALGDVMPQETWRPAMDWFAIDTDLQAVARESFAAQRILAEALSVAGSLLSFALILHLTMLASAGWFTGYQPRYWLFTVLAAIAITLLVRSIWVVLLSGPSGLALWFNAGAQAGIVLALLSAYSLAGLRPEVQRLIAILGLALTLALANMLPENDFASAAFQAWSGGRWLNLKLLANLAAMSFPFFALAWIGFVINGRALKAASPGYFGR
jgi:VanZ family protein